MVIYGLKRVNQGILGKEPQVSRRPILSLRVSRRGPGFSLLTE
jgi:hypothetical protein